MSFNSNSSFGFDTFTNANGNDLGLAFNLNPLSNSDEGKSNVGDLQIVFEQTMSKTNLNSTSTGVLQLEIYLIQTLQELNTKEFR